MNWFEDAEQSFFRHLFICRALLVRVAPYVFFNSFYIIFLSTANVYARFCSINYQSYLLKIRHIETYQCVWYTVYNIIQQNEWLCFSKLYISIYLFTIIEKKMVFIALRWYRKGMLYWFNRFQLYNNIVTCCFCLEEIKGIPFVFNIKFQKNENVQPQPTKETEKWCDVAHLFIILMEHCFCKHFFQLCLHFNASDIQINCVGASFIYISAVWAS